MKLALSLAFAGGILLACSTGASAVMAPPAPNSHASGIIDVRDGCGRGYHRNRWGHCRENSDWNDDNDHDHDHDHDGDWHHHHDHDNDGDGCDRYHHWHHGRCVRNW